MDRSVDPRDSDVEQSECVHRLLGHHRRRRDYVADRHRLLIQLRRDGLFTAAGHDERPPAVRSDELRRRDAKRRPAADLHVAVSGCQHRAHDESLRRRSRCKPDGIGQWSGSDDVRGSGLRGALHPDAARDGSLPPVRRDLGGRAGLGFHGQLLQLAGHPQRGRQLRVSVRTQQQSRRRTRRHRLGAHDRRRGHGLVHGYRFAREHGDPVL